MLLRNVHIIPSGEKKSIHIKGGKIESIGLNEVADNVQIDFMDEAIAFPGLINSHDHLDFNLFPNISNRVYNNYTEWGADIHHNNKPVINALLQIPLPLSVQWGIYKNLLNGVTTVVNHGDHLTIDAPLMSVHQQSYTLHSVKFEKGWRWKLNNPLFNKYPFAIHAGEGTDTAAYEEINELIRWNIFKKKLIAIHGVAMAMQQAKHFKALVWCPASNYFLLNKTADIANLQNETTILFGTDSTLTASWDIWGQLRMARQLALVDDNTLFNMVTVNAARVWGVANIGSIKEGFIADIVVAKKNGGTPMDSFFALGAEDILLVIHKGEIRLFDAGLKEQLLKSNYSIESFSKITAGDAIKYIQGDLPKLISAIKSYNANTSFPNEITC